MIKQDWLGNSSVSLSYVFGSLFLCSLALTVHKSQKIFRTTNQ